MKIEKLPSDSYRVRKTIDGRRISVVLPYKPSKKEALQLLHEKASGEALTKITFDEAAKKYIAGKQTVLSPSTVAGYESTLKRIDDEIKNKMLCDITPWDVQVFIDRYARDHSPKTVRNVHGFISAVFRAFCPQTKLYTKLPQNRRETRDLPSDKDVKRILSSVKGTNYEIPLRLACYGLRKSEICALTSEDLDGNTLTISKALVKNSNNEYVIKTTKTESSTREIIIDDELAALIRKKGFYNGNPDCIYDRLRKAQADLKIDPFPLHYLRHYYASTAHALGIPDAVIMETGGWRTDHVMKRVYRHAKDTTKEQKKMVKHMKKIT